MKMNDSQSTDHQQMLTQYNVQCYKWHP